MNPLVQIRHYLCQPSFLSRIPVENPLKTVLARVLHRSVNLLPFVSLRSVRSGLGPGLTAGDHSALRF